MAAKQLYHTAEPTSASTTDTMVETPHPIINTTITTANTTAGALSTQHELQCQPAVSPPSPSSLPPYIPYEDLQGRTLIVCFDGTGDQFDSDNSNIVQLVSMLKKDDKTKQMVYYQAGIGTYISPAVATPFMSRISKTFDEMFAWNLDAHVMSGYEFLMQNYIAGDKICIFGFSRGAYTAQSLAGMIHKVGLLPAGNHQQVPFAYKMYTRTDSIGWNQSNAFKKAFSVDVTIEFLGVWDTVASVGLIPKRLPFTASNTIVKTFRHAVALDERRAKFKANLWNRPTKAEQRLGFKPAPHVRKHHDKIKLPFLNRSHSGDDANEKAPRKSEDSETHDAHHYYADGRTGDHKKYHRGAKLWKLNGKADVAMNHFESIYGDHINKPTDVEEVWFAGCHCDVGGGSVANGTRYSLARIPLRWMIRECFRTSSGILFNTDSLREIGLDPGMLYPFVLPRPPALLDHAKTEMVVKPSPSSLKAWARGLFTSKEKQATAKDERPDTTLSNFISEEDEELYDALSPKYDQLKVKRGWWVLEVLPVSMRYQRGDDRWVSYIGINMGRSRFIPKQRTRGVKVHRSVKLRMEAQCPAGNKYLPKANLAIEPTWID